MGYCPFPEAFLILTGRWKLLEMLVQEKVIKEKIIYLACREMRWERNGVERSQRVDPEQKSKKLVVHLQPCLPSTIIMSHHLFLLSPSDTPLYSLTHHSTKPVTSATLPLAANLPTWSTSAFAGTLTALSGASSVPQHTTDGSVRMGGGQDRHVIQMIANASLDVIEDVMRKENTMYVHY